MNGTVNELQQELRATQIELKHQQDKNIALRKSNDRLLKLRHIDSKIGVLAERFHEFHQEKDKRFRELDTHFQRFHEEIKNVNELHRRQISNLKSAHGVELNTLRQQLKQSKESVENLLGNLHSTKGLFESTMNNLKQKLILNDGDIEAKIEKIFAHNDIFNPDGKWLSYDHINDPNVRPLIVEITNKMGTFIKYNQDISETERAVHARRPEITRLAEVVRKNTVIDDALRFAHEQRAHVNVAEVLQAVNDKSDDAPRLLSALVATYEREIFDLEKIILRNEKEIKEYYDFESQTLAEMENGTWGDLHRRIDGRLLAILQEIEDLQHRSVNSPFKAIAEHFARHMDETRFQNIETARNAPPGPIRDASIRKMIRGYEEEIRALEEMTLEHSINGMFANLGDAIVNGSQTAIMLNNIQLEMKMLRQGRRELDVNHEYKISQNIDRLLNMGSGTNQINQLDILLEEYARRLTNLYANIIKHMAENSRMEQYVNFENRGQDPFSERRAEQADYNEMRSDYERRISDLMREINDLKSLPRGAGAPFYGGFNENLPPNANDYIYDNAANRGAQEPLVITREVPTIVVQEVPKIVHRTVEVPQIVERIVEVPQIVEKTVEVPQIVTRTIEVPKVVTEIERVIEERPVIETQIIEKEVPKIITRIEERPVEVIETQIIEKEVPKIVTREVVVEKEMPPKIIEVPKIVHRETVVEVPQIVMQERPEDAQEREQLIEEQRRVMDELNNRTAFFEERIRDINGQCDQRLAQIQSEYGARENGFLQELERKRDEIDQLSRQLNATQSQMQEIEIRHQQELDQWRSAAQGGYVIEGDDSAHAAGMMWKAEMEALKEEFIRKERLLLDEIRELEQLFEANIDELEWKVRDLDAQHQAENQKMRDQEKSLESQLMQVHNQLRSEINGLQYDVANQAQINMENARNVEEAHAYTVDIQDQVACAESLLNSLRNLADEEITENIIVEPAPVNVMYAAPPPAPVFVPAPRPTYVPPIIEEYAPPPDVAFINPVSPKRDPTDFVFEPSKAEIPKSEATEVRRERIEEEVSGIVEKNMDTATDDSRTDLERKMDEDIAKLEEEVRQEVKEEEGHHVKKKRRRASLDIDAMEAKIRARRKRKETERAERKKKVGMDIDAMEEKIRARRDKDKATRHAFIENEVEEAFETGGKDADKRRRKKITRKTKGKLDIEAMEAKIRARRQRKDAEENNSLQNQDKKSRTQSRKEKRKKIRNEARLKM